MMPGPAPPLEMVMPDTPQAIFNIGNVAVCAAAFAYAEYYRRRSGSAVGFLLLLAGAAAVINEPAVDVLGLCWFADRGGIGLFKAWGVTIPIFMLPVYCWYVGGQALLAYGAIITGVTTRRVFQLYAIFAVVNVVLELPGLNMGIYAYYGNQPFEAFGFPFWWPLCNARMPIVMWLALTLALLVARIVAVDTDPVAGQARISITRYRLFIHPEFIVPIFLGGVQWKSSVAEKCMFTKRSMKVLIPLDRRNCGRRAWCCCGGT